MFYIGVAFIVALWSVAVGKGGTEIDYSAGVFSSTPLLIQWVMLALASVFLFFSFYGSRPDRFVLLLPVAVILNSGFAATASFFHLPFFLNFVGTVLITVLGGPALGLLSGCLTVLMWSVYISAFLPNSLTYAVIVVMVAIAVRKGKFTTLLNIMGLGMATGVLTGVCSWLTFMFAVPYSDAVGAPMLSDYFVLIHFPEKLSLFLHFIITEPISSTYVMIVVALMIRYLSDTVLSMFVSEKNPQRVLSGSNSVVEPKSPQVDHEGGKHSAPQLELS